MNADPSTVQSLSDSEPYTRPRFEWDLWELEALEEGLDKDLATLGRSVMREAYQHSWDPRVARLCQPLILDRLLFHAPEFGRELYTVLLQSDGLRGACDEKSGDWLELGAFQ